MVEVWLDEVVPGYLSGCGELAGALGEDEGCLDEPYCDDEDGF